MTKNSYKTVKLGKGEVYVYDAGEVKLHAYKTNDLINDEVFIIEKGGRAVIIESPCFFDNIQELSEYVNGFSEACMLISYHDAGGSFLPNVQKYATKGAKNYGEVGGGKAIIDSFVNAFGTAFDSELHKITKTIEGGKLELFGIEFVIRETPDAFNIEIPELNAVYTHMLGHDCHSIVAGASHADAIIAELEEYIEKGISLILTSHYTPEDLKDARTKIEYLQELKKIAAGSKNAEEFKTQVSERFPNYGGGNYLDMTASMFFAE